MWMKNRFYVPSPKFARLLVFAGAVLLPSALNAQTWVVHGPPPAVNQVPTNVTGCFAQVAVPARTETYQDQVVVEPARQEERVIPARYGEVGEPVVVREGEEKLRVVPATYKTVQEQVVVRPAARKIVSVPAQYRTVTERIEISPPQRVWRNDCVNTSRINNATGESLCLEEIAGEYQTVTRQVLVSPAGQREEVIPPVVKTVEKRVIDKPAQVVRELIPPETTEVTKRVIIEPARREIVTIPPVYRSVTRTRVVAPSTAEWRAVPCESQQVASGGTSTINNSVALIQRALQGRGFDPGPIDGRMGPRTRAALSRFQASSGLNPTGQVDQQTLAALGLVRQ